MHRIYRMYIEINQTQKKKRIIKHIGKIAMSLQNGGEKKRKQCHMILVPGI